LRKPEELSGRTLKERVTGSKAERKKNLRSTRRLIFPQKAPLEIVALTDPNDPEFRARATGLSASRR
jgi:hypothetical protein